MNDKTGKLIVISAPSGTGKTTVVKKLLEKTPNLVASISFTTRTRRENEKEGADYFFIDEKTFKDMIHNDDFLEHATVFGNLYGTEKESVLKNLREGINVILEIDWQGAQQLGEVAGDDLVRVFILPPSTDELYRRLNQRAQDSDEVVETRMARAADEMSHWAEYDFIIINEDIEVSVGRVQSILMAERLRRQRQVGLSDFVKRLQEGY